MDGRMTKIKFCGMRNTDDVINACTLGIDALGFVFTESKRKVKPETVKNIITKIPPFISKTGVFMNDSLEKVVEITVYTGIDTIQLHGDESVEYCKNLRNITKKTIVKRIDVSNQNSLFENIEEYGDFPLLFDPGEGSGETFDLNVLRGINFPYILAGGLNPSNVGEITSRIKIYAVDVSSGIENGSGQKDFRKMKKFVEEVRGCRLQKS